VGVEAVPVPAALLAVVVEAEALAASLPAGRPADSDLADGGAPVLAAGLVFEHAAAPRSDC
jgi:hypothetical protein